MTFLSNIQSVAKYESKLLIRSWFFRVFTVLAIGITTLFNFLLFVSEDTYGFWIAMSIPSNIPYLILLLLNTGQAVIAIFLASDFLKRDKKLDTSEVLSLIHIFNTLNEDEKNSWYSICFSLLGNFVTCTVRSCDRNF